MKVFLYICTHLLTTSFPTYLLQPFLSKQTVFLIRAWLLITCPTAAYPTHQRLKFLAILISRGVGKGLWQLSKKLDSSNNFGTAMPQLVTKNLKISMGIEPRSFRTAASCSTAFYLLSSLVEQNRLLLERSF